MSDATPLLPQGIPLCDTARLLYAYWRAGGLATAITAQLVQTGVVAVAVAAAAILLGGGVDYQELSARIARPFCPNGKRNTAALYVADCYGHQPIDPARVHQMSSLLLAALAVVLGAWLAATVVFLVWDLPRLIRARRICRRTLGLSHSELQSIEWPELARQLLGHAADARPDIGRPTSPLTEHDLAVCITREDDYLIGLIAVGALQPRLWPGGAPYMPLSLFWNIEFALDYAVGHPYEASTAVARRLRLVLRVLAVTNLVLAPVILLCRLVHAVMWHGERVRRHPHRLSARQWSPVARLRFRRYGELPHQLDARLGQAHADASAYAAGFRDRVVEVLARGLVAVAGGFVAITVLLTAIYDEEYLGLELTPDRSVAFWVAAAGAVVTVAAAQLPDDDVTEVSLADRLDRVAKHVDLPPRWHTTPESPTTRLELVRVFPYKCTVLIDEFVAAICNPWVLAMTLPAQAQAIAGFYADTMRLHSLAGHCCALVLPDSSAPEVLRETVVEDPEEHSLKLFQLYQQHN
jgi:autophagy-related protein 9